ncbi:Thaumatin family [Dillenia turbinata]|uniref:Thaumatin family n=1 Tax=Dillenia turbinata TaxID=194707 RepID=A0AAN8Z8K1_9MAGN
MKVGLLDLIAPLTVVKLVDDILWLSGMTVLEWYGCDDAHVFIHGLAILFFQTDFVILDMHNALQLRNVIVPGILSGAGTTQLSTTGFSLSPAQSTTLSIPTSWSGRLWARTYCSQDSTTGKFTCLTGDCGTGTIECSGNGATPPATLAEFTLNGADGLDFYDVSLVDGYNLPMMITAEGGTGGNCSTTGCAVDVNLGCPTELRIMSTSTSSSGDNVVVACKSACDAFGEPQYCCTDQYSSSATCKPTAYSEFFKSACPRAYSYAYDDGTSTFTCANANYVITFCPPSSGYVAFHV